MNSVRATEMSVNPAIVPHLIAAILAVQPGNANLRHALVKAHEQIALQRAYILRGHQLHVQSSRPELATQFYDCTVETCDCEAFQRSGYWCWHRALLLLVLGSQVLQASVFAGQAAVDAQQQTVPPRPPARSRQRACPGDRVHERPMDPALRARIDELKRTRTPDEIAASLAA